MLYYRHNNPFEEGTLEHSLWLKEAEIREKQEEARKKREREKKVTQIYAIGCSWIMLGFIIYLFVEYLS